MRRLKAQLVGMVSGMICPLTHLFYLTRCLRPASITISLYAGPTASSAHSYGAGGAGPRKRIFRATCDRLITCFKDV